MKKIEKILIALCLVVIVVLFSGVLRAQVVVSDGIVLGLDGKAAVPLRLDTSLEKVAGLQGTLLYDPAKIDSVTLALAPEQPGSFAVRSHQAKPGEISFIAYSASDTFIKDKPVLYSHVDLDDREPLAGFESTIVYELTYLGAPDAQIHLEANKYVNVPLKGLPKASAEDHWALY